MRLCSAADGECRNPATAAAAFAGERFAPLQQPLGGSAAQFRRPLSLRTTPPAPAAARRLAGRLNKTCILSPQPAVFRRSCGGGSFASLTPCRRWRHIQAAYGGGIVPPATGGGLACSAAQSRSVRSNRPSLSAAVRTTRPQVHIIASRIYRCGSKAAEHGRYCKFCDTVSLRKFFSPSAGLSAPQTVF